MSILIPGTEQGVLEDIGALRTYNPIVEAYEDCDRAMEHDGDAWREVWPDGVSAYVYGAASETVTIRRNGIIIATVETDSFGRSTEKIMLSHGAYTLTGSVSGWTEEQTVDKDTTKFRAMPEKALYWYGNECGYNYLKKNNANVNSSYADSEKGTNWIDCWSNSKYSIENRYIAGYMNENPIDISSSSTLKITSELVSGSVATNTWAGVLGFASKNVEYNAINWITNFLISKGFGTASKQTEALTGIPSNMKYLWILTNHGYPGAAFRSRLHAIWLES